MIICENYHYKPLSLINGQYITLSFLVQAESKLLKGELKEKCSELTFHLIYSSQTISQYI